MPISSPLDLASCQRWYDAEDSSTLDGAQGLTYSWDDKSANLASFTFQSEIPLGIFDFNGKRCLRVIGDGGYIRDDAAATYFTGNFTWTAVIGIRITTASGGRWSIAAGRSSSATPLTQFGCVSSKYTFQRRNDANTLRTLTSAGDADYLPACFSARWDGSNVELWRNGSSLGSGTSSGAITLDQFAIGVSPRNTMVNPGDLLIFGFVLCNSALSAGDRGDLETYMTNRHIVTVSNDYAWPTHFAFDRRAKLFRPQRSGSTYSAVLSLGRNRHDGSGLYYVDWVNGSDSNPGTSGSQYKTISKALEQADVNGVVLASGLHGGSTASWNNTYTQPDRSVCMWSTGRALIAVTEDDITWSLTAAQTNTYEITRTAATTRVVDMTNVNSKGKPAALTSRASIALVEANPGSYFSDGGTSKVYVHTWDSRAPDQNVIVQIGTWSPRAPFTSANRFLRLENITFVGYTGTVAGSNVLDKTGCQYYYDEVDAWYGDEFNHQLADEVYRDSCKIGASSSDLFDYGRAANGGGPMGVEYRCTSAESGSADADNATTAHGTSTGSAVVRWQGDYSNASRLAHDIEDTENWYADSDFSSCNDPGTDTGHAIVAGGFGATESTNTTVEKCRFNGIPQEMLVANGGCFVFAKQMNPAAITIEENGTGDVQFSDNLVTPPLAMHHYRRRRAG